MKQLVRNEKGQALIVVLGFLAIGGLVIAPLLTYMSTGLNAGQVHKEKMVGFYCADSGVEHAYWRLLHETGFAESMTAGSPTVQYSTNISGTGSRSSVTTL